MGWAIWGYLFQTQIQRFPHRAEDGTERKRENLIAGVPIEICHPGAEKIYSCAILRLHHAIADNREEERQQPVFGGIACSPQFGESAKRKAISSYTSINSPLPDVSDGNPILYSRSGGGNLVWGGSEDVPLPAFDTPLLEALPFSVLSYGDRNCGRRARV